jgi:hypothetical protein
MITCDIFEAFLRYDGKAYLKSLGRTGDSSGYTDWEREVREDYRRSCQTRCRFIFQDVLGSPQPSLQEDLAGRLSLFETGHLPSFTFSSRIKVSARSFGCVHANRSRAFLEISSSYSLF